MRFLFVCHVVSPFLAPIMEHISAQPDNELILAFERARKGSEISGARKVKFKHSDPKKPPETIFDCWQQAVQNGKLAHQSFTALAESGFKPDVIMLATQNGASLGLSGLFPEAFRIAYFEYFPEKTGVNARFRSQMRVLQAYESDLAFAFGHIDPKLRAWVKPAPLAINTDFYTPAKNIHDQHDADSPARLFCLKGLNASSFTQWLEIALADAKKNNEKIILLLPDVNTLRNCMAVITQNKQLAGKVECICNPAEADARDIFRKIRILVWPGQEILPEALQAMSCGVTLAASPIGEILIPGYNCIPLQAYQTDTAPLPETGLRARQSVLEKFSLERVIPRHFDQIYETMAKKSLARQEAVFTASYAGLHNPARRDKRRE